MSDKLISEMSYDEFISLINDYIDRSSQQTGEIPTSSFFELLFNQDTHGIIDTVETTNKPNNRQKE
ncbi:MAG: hypothetical protein AAF639_36525 [Chloroflexota bacterium]